MIPVSIVLPTFNRLRYLRPTVDSVFAQTLRDWELIVADDGSDDETRAYLRDLEQRANVKVVWLRHTGVPAMVRNAGLRAATGQYVAFLDSDDLWAPSKLERQIAGLQLRPECEWSYTAFTQVDGLTQVLDAEQRRRWRPHQGEIFEETVTTAAAIRTPCVLATRRILRSEGGFDETLRSSEDFDLWMRLALRSPVALVDEPLAQIRRHESNYSLSWAIAYHGRDRSLKKIELLAGPRHRALLRRERAKNGAQLMKEHARRGETGDVLRAMVRSAPDSWRHIEWWKGILRAAVDLYAPSHPRP